MKNIFPAIQKLGRSLMLPIAVLPVAGLLLRLGQPDLLNIRHGFGFSAGLKMTR
jgi:PTS system N-acetylglucosamine-specific IIC component